MQMRDLREDFRQHCESARPDSNGELLSTWDREYNDMADGLAKRAAAGHSPPTHTQRFQAKAYKSDLAAIARRPT